MFRVVDAMPILVIFFPIAFVAAAIGVFQPSFTLLFALDKLAFIFAMCLKVIEDAIAIHLPFQEGALVRILVIELHFAEPLYLILAELALVLHYVVVVVHVRYLSVAVHHVHVNLPDVVVTETGGL